MAYYDNVYVLIKQNHTDGTFNYSIMGVFPTQERAMEYRDKLINEFKRYVDHRFIIERHSFNSMEW